MLRVSIARKKNRHVSECQYFTPTGLKASLEKTEGGWGYAVFQHRACKEEGWGKKTSVR